MPVAIVTGASQGLGRALTAALAAQGWDLVVDARHAEQLSEAARALASAPGRVVPLVGDVADEEHRRALVTAAEDLGGPDLLVNNASTLGVSPLVPVQQLTSTVLRHVWETNVVGPMALIRALRPLLLDGAVVVDVTSDAAVEHYETWGGYAASKAALDHLTMTLGVENPWLAAYAVDPGDMRTAMQQAAFPGEDISDRQPPERVVAHLLALLAQRPPSGRYRAASFAADPQGVSA